MKDAVLQFFEQYPQLAIGASLLLSILLAVVGVLPSFFITAANILFFGFWPGVALSFLGEALGAVVAFYLYRKGFKQEASERLKKYKRINQLLEAENKEAFWLVLSLRLIPFVPSGLVTFAAAVGRVNWLTFVISSSLGKLPALLLEGYAVFQVTEFGWQGKIILTVCALLILYLVVKSTIRKKEA